jgi:hypothetical protein
MFASTISRSLRGTIPGRSIGLNRLDAFLVDLECSDFRIDILPRVIFQLSVELVIADHCSIGWSIVEIHLVEVLIGDLRELLLPVLSGGAGKHSGGHKHSNRE